MNRLLGDISSTIDYGVTASAVNSPVGPKFLRITDIQDGAVDWDTVPWCDCSEREAASSQLQDGDIVFARTGATTGKSFLIRQAPSKSVFAS
ncbi:MAG: restriction endonuclease subunit S, partial [Tepidisphaeraceae bacterium]